MQFRFPFHVIKIFETPCQLQRSSPTCLQINIQPLFVLLSTRIVRDGFTKTCIDCFSNGFAVVSHNTSTDATVSKAAKETVSEYHRQAHFPFIFQDACL